MKLLLFSFIIKGTILGALGIAIILGILESIFDIERFSNLAIFTVSFGLSFVISNILYLVGHMLLQKDKRDDEIRELKRELEKMKLENEVASRN